MIPTPVIADSLEGVLAELDRIIADATKNRDRLGYFAGLYRKVTIKVKEGIQSGEFGDGKNIAALDVHFANRYFFALSQWKRGKAVSQSWQVAFEAASKGKYLILQHLLLGMNAHINLDLGIATYEVSDGNLDDFRKDYNYINLILSSLTYGVISQLGLLSPLISVLGFSGTHSNLMLVQFSLGNARDGSWCFAEELKIHKGTDYDSFILQRDKEIAELGKSLLYTRGIARFGIWLIHLFEKKNVPYIIDILSNYRRKYKKDMSELKH